MTTDTLNLHPGIRWATEGDLERIMEIEKLCFQDQWNYWQFKAALKDLFFVFEPQEIQGFLIACTCGIAKRAFIMRIAVHPDYRGQGVASHLIAAALEIIKLKNLKSVELDVDIVKKGAIKLYEKFGFKTMRVATLNHEDEEASFLMMKLSLNNS